MTTALTIVLIVVALVVGLLVLWRVASAIYMRLYRPLFWSIDQYQKQLFIKFNFPPWVIPAKFERSTLAVGDGVVLSLYVLQGPPGSPVVVFMPGTAVYAELYSNFLFSVHRRGYTVIGYDPRGHGQSGRLCGMFDLPQLVADAQKVCAYAKQRFGTKVGFSGSSQGGLTGFYLAATGDPNVDTVMCHNIAYADGDTILQISVFKPPVWAVPLLVCLFKRMRAFVAPVTFYLPFDKLKLPDGQPALPLLQGDAMATRFYSLGAVGSLAVTPLATPIDKIKTPLLLLSSTLDEVFPAGYEQMLFDRLTCEKQFVLIPDQYHLMLVFFANEPWLLDSIISWFDRHLR